MRTKEVNIVIMEDDLYQNKALTKYIQTLCNGSHYPATSFNIKSYTNPHQCIDELDENLDILLLDYYLISRESKHFITGGDVLDIVNESCNNCHVIMISSQEDEEIISRLKRKGIQEYVDKNLNSMNRVGAVLQAMLQKHNLAA